MSSLVRGYVGRLSKHTLYLYIFISLTLHLFHHGDFKSLWGRDSAWLLREPLGKSPGITSQPFLITLKLVTVVFKPFTLEFMSPFRNGHKTCKFPCEKLTLVSIINEQTGWLKQQNLFSCNYGGRNLLKIFIYVF